MGGGAGVAEGTHTQGGEEAREVAGEGGRGDYLREEVRRRRGEGGRREGGRDRGTVVCSIILENATGLGSRTRVLDRRFYIIVPIH